MIESLLHWDLSAFHAINAKWTAPILDMVLPFLREAYFWIPVYGLILSWAIIRFGMKGVAWLLALIAVFALTDLLAAGLIKPWVHRIRPCNGEVVRLLVNCGGGYSFPSAHASNHFGLSFFIYLTTRHTLKPWLRYLVLFWAFAVSYSQIYVGVHYPIDVIVGGILGFLVARSISLYFHSRYRLTS